MIKTKRINSKFAGSLITALVLLIIAGIIPILSSLSLLESLRIVFGSVFVLFVPGFIISYIFFPKSKPFDSEKDEKGAIDMLERFALGFALSIALVPLVVFYLNLVGVRISALNTSLIILGIIVISSGILYWRNRTS